MLRGVFILNGQEDAADIANGGVLSLLIIEAKLTRDTEMFG